MNIFILDMVLSMLLTIVTYLFIPFILICINKRMTRKKMLYVSIANGCLVFMLWNVFRIATDQEFNTNVHPAWLWSAIGYALIKKRLSLDTINEEEPNVPGADCSPVEDQIVNISHTIGHTDNMQASTIKPKYCHKCGKVIDNKSKQCSGCGKQYFRWKYLLNIILIIVPIIGLASALFYYYSEYEYYHSQYIQASLENDELKRILEQKENELCNINDSIDELSEKIYPMLDDIEFYHEHVVFRSDDGTELYHKYGCPQLDTSEFWAYNTEYAESLGFKPCNFCSNQDYPIETPTRDDFIKKYGNHHINN